MLNNFGKNNTVNQNDHLYNYNKKNDYILMYVIKSKKLCGVWQADGMPFYEETALLHSSYF